MSDAKRLQEQPIPSQTKMSEYLPIQSAASLSPEESELHSSKHGIMEYFKYKINNLIKLSRFINIGL